MEEHKHDCDVHENRIENCETRLDKIDIVLDKVRNRLPTWATFVFGALLLVIGYLISLVKVTP